MSENRLKISNPERILRILQRICEANLPVMVRSGGSVAVSVKGRAGQLLMVGNPPAMRISHVSVQGLEYLAGQVEVQVEFIMMATKVMFMTKILQRDSSGLLISMPLSLVSIERRKNTRFPCTDDWMGYVDINNWQPAADDLTAPPFFAHHRQVAAYLAIVDISSGGLCAVSRFPAVAGVLKRGVLDQGAKLVLPLQEPLGVTVEVRWVKRIKENVKAGDSAEVRALRSYRFGIQFVEQSDQVRLSIRQFIQQLSQAGAI